MKILIGHVFSKGIIKRKGPYARHWIVEVKINSRKVDTILEPEYAPHYMDIRKNIIKGETIKNIVCIKHQGNKWYVAKNNYLEDLISFYYIKKKNKSQNRFWLTDNRYFYKPKINEWYVWYKRWKEECAVQFPQNFIIDEIPYDTKQNNLRVFELKGKNYVLPVYGYKDIDSLEGRSLFYPSIIEKNRFIEQSVYKTDNKDIFPSKYTAKVENKNVLKDVNIFLHGFTYPAKWHYGIWKHVLALSPGAKDKETLLWKDITDNGLPLPEDLFNRCKARTNKNNKEITCDETHCIEESLFREVHPEIRIMCQKYMEKMVTTFDSNATNVILMYPGPYENCTSIKLVYTYQKSGVYHCVVFYGICHNWNDNNHKPVFHLTPVTMYKDTRKIHNKGKDNDSNIPVFEGCLKEVKRC